MTEYYIRKNPNVIQRLVQDGNLVCNHTANHVGVTGLSYKRFQEELLLVEDAYREATGQELSKYFRPPQGKFSELTLGYAERMGYTTVFWSFRYVDWETNNQPSLTNAYSTIMNSTHPGEIVLLHAQSSTNVKILDKIISSWQEMGYTFQTIDRIPTKGPSEITV